MDYKTTLEQWRKRRAEITALVAKGKSISEVARKYGVSRQRVHRIVRAAK